MAFTKDLIDRMKAASESEKIKMLRKYQLAVRNKKIDRNYPVEHALYNTRPTQKIHKKLRRENRRYFTKKGKVKPGDGKEIHHKDGNPMNNRLSNLQVVTRKQHDILSRTI